jgi:hypothetical protein
MHWQVFWLTPYFQRLPTPLNGTVAGMLKRSYGLTAAETARDFHPVPFYYLSRPAQVNQYGVKVMKNNSPL